VEASGSGCQSDQEVSCLLAPYADLLERIRRHILPQRIDRYRWFFTTPGRGRLIIQTHLPARHKAPITPLSQADLANDLQRLVAEQAAAFLAAWQDRPELDDDLLPCKHFFSGIAEQVAFWGGQVTLTDQTSWPSPFLPDLSDESLSRLNIDPGRLWSRFPIEAIRLLRKLGIPTGPRGIFGPFDLACGVRGHDFLTDLIEYPTAARCLLDLATDAATWWMQQQLSTAGQVAGGTILPYFGLWLPGEVAGHIAIDYGVMVSPELIAQFVLPCEQHFASRFAGAAYHLHNVGWHLIEPTCRIDNLKMLEITDDPAAPRTADKYGELLETCGELPVMIYPEPEEVFTNIDLLAAHNVIICMTAENLGSDRPLSVARELVKLVRDRCPLP